MRKNLKIFRIRLGLNQQEISDAIGCTRATYSAIETGARNGKQTFWQALQDAFGVDDDKMWDLMKIEDKINLI